MKVLVLNSGSSSIKYQLFLSEDWVALASGSVSRIGEPEGEIKEEWLDASGIRQSGRARVSIPTHRDGIDRIVRALHETRVLGDVSELTVIGHRVVHGGEHFKRPTIVDDAVVDAIRDVVPLAPLHNPAHLAGIEVARRLFPTVPSVAVFDTAYHQTMPRTSYRYAIPEWLYREHRIRRYGFHGTSHYYVAKRAAVMLGRPLESCNLITLHLGNGSSATAIRDGKSVDTSMGLTPLEGLVMGTRCGDIDPAIHFFLAKNLGLEIAAIEDLLNRQSGLLGISGVNDMREIDRLAEEGNDGAELAIGITAHRIKKYIGAYYAELGRVDAVVFTGGIGENAAEIRCRACEGLENLGIKMDDIANYALEERGERCISTPESAVQVLVIPTNEELEIAQQSLAAASEAPNEG
ncbi:MAG: acetate kinase [Thiocapsa sp.]|uniref:acetate/propionate family kinase n=1 Tax=Thiocapsa sp. TaxID=2024551 RepID=UPI001BD02732|nr:acetate kinase [Thiocapsa sp.]QVL47093.1 MAG: acetate kinase [Thiocapsa sp.]